MTCRHGLLDECRVLLMHGLLHLLGHDHETGDADAAAMASAERQLLRALGWQVCKHACPRGLGSLPWRAPISSLRGSCMLLLVDVSGRLTPSEVPCMWIITHACASLQGEGLISASEAVTHDAEAPAAQGHASMDPAGAAGMSRFRVLAAGIRPDEQGPKKAARSRESTRLDDDTESWQGIIDAMLSMQSQAFEHMRALESRIEHIRGLESRMQAVESRMAALQPHSSGGSASTSAPSSQRSQPSAGSQTPAATGQLRRAKPHHRRDIRLICIDMDGACPAAQWPIACMQAGNVSGADGRCSGGSQATSNLTSCLVADACVEGWG